MKFFRHVCDVDYVTYCSHYNQICFLEDSLKNPTWHHYPSKETIQSWIDTGNLYAQVFQSHWNCNCGKNKTFFFLAHPKPGEPGENGPPIQTISMDTFKEMRESNPWHQGCEPGSTMTELTNELIKEFC